MSTRLHSSWDVAHFTLRSTEISIAFSALTLLVGRQEGYPACKNRVVGYWHGYLSGARCTVSCSSKIQIGFTFLVPAYPGCPGKEAVKWL